MGRRPLRDETRAVGLDLRRPTRERADSAGEFGDLPRAVECVPVACERGDPCRVGAGGEFTLGVHDGVQLHGDTRIDVRPLAIRTEHLDVQPQVPMDVRVERTRPSMLQLDNFDALDLLADAATMPASRVELRLPSEQDAVTQPVLQGFELGSKFRMQQRRDAVGLRVVERAVEQQVSIGTQPLTTALLPRDRIMPNEPDPKAAGG